MRCPRRSLRPGRPTGFAGCATGWRCGWAARAGPASDRGRGLVASYFPGDEGVERHEDLGPLAAEEQVVRAHREQRLLEEEAVAQREPDPLAHRGEEGAGVRVRPPVWLARHGRRLLTEAWV